MTTSSSRREMQAVSTGFALGLFRCGHVGIPSRNRTDIQSAFRLAWKHWDRRDAFPSVVRLVNMGVFGLDQIRASTARAGFNDDLYWEGTWPPAIVWVDDEWTPGDGRLPDAVAEALPGAVSQDAWAELAAAFLEYLGVSGPNQ